MDSLRKVSQLEPETLFLCFEPPFVSTATDPGPSARSMFQGPQSNPVSPTATSSSIPSSPTYDGPRTGHRSSPQSRRGKHRASAPSSPGLATGPPTHGIVSYLQQMHGLTKKRSYGQKSSKRITSGEQTRPSNSSRPILPRLDLPDSRLRGWSPYPVSSPPNRSIMEKTAAGGSRYSHIAPAPFDLSEDTHRARSRWPWLHPTPLPPTSSEQSAVYTNNSALRSLVSMAPRHPDFTTRVADEAGIGFPSSSRVDPLAVGASYSHTDSPSHTSSQSTEWVADQHSQIVGVGLSSTPSPTIMTSPRTRGFWKSPTLSAQYHEQQSHSRATVSYDHPLDDNVRTPLASPSSPSENPEDPENQPFVITPEYEAMANARFEAAVRSGAMQASMTAATLSPIAASPLSIGSPSDYFGGTSVSNSSRLIMSLPQHPAASLPPQQPYSHRTMYSDPYIDLPSKTSDPSQYRDGSPVRQPYHWYGPI